MARSLLGFGIALPVVDHFGLDRQGAEQGVEGRQVEGLDAGTHAGPRSTTGMPPRALPRGATASARRVSPLARGARLCSSPSRTGQDKAQRPSCAGVASKPAWKRSARRPG